MEDGVYGQTELAASHKGQVPLPGLDHALTLQRPVPGQRQRQWRARDL